MPGEPFYIEKISTDGREVVSELNNFKTAAEKFANFYKIHIHLHALTCKDAIHLYNRELRKLRLDPPTWAEHLQTNRCHGFMDYTSKTNIQFTV